MKTDELWTLALTFPAEGRVERRVCVVCAADVRRALLATPKAAPVEALHAKPVVDIVPPSPAARFRWFVTRWALYAAVAILAFVVVTWLAAR